MIAISLLQLRAKHPRTDGESDVDYVARMVAERKVVVLSRADARDMRSYLRLVDESEKLRVPVLQWDAPAALVDDTNTTVIGRDTARNLQSYMVTKAISEASGKASRIADYVPPTDR